MYVAELLRSFLLHKPTKDVEYLFSYALLCWCQYFFLHFTVSIYRISYGVYINKYDMWASNPYNRNPICIWQATSNMFYSEFLVKTVQYHILLFPFSLVRMCYTFNLQFFQMAQCNSEIKLLPLWRTFSCLPIWKCLQHSYIWDYSSSTLSNTWFPEYWVAVHNCCNNVIRVFFHWIRSWLGQSHRYSHWKSNRDRDKIVSLL